jgi:hypothetical protein
MLRLRYGIGPQHSEYYSGKMISLPDYFALQQWEAEISASHCCCYYASPMPGTTFEKPAST